MTIEYCIYRGKKYLVTKRDNTYAYLIPFEKRNNYTHLKPIQVRLSKLDIIRRNTQLWLN